jgi:hypothetical protein
LESLIVIEIAFSFMSRKTVVAKQPTPLLLFAKA